MFRTLFLLSTGLLLACPEPSSDPTQPSPIDTATDPSGSLDTGETGDTGELEERAAWTILVFMNGDNDLESAIWDDLNELEAVGSNEDVHILVQVDRHESYWSGDGDWTDARRYYIDHDTDDDVLASTLIESLGEVDMGDPAVLSDFLLWAEENYPAERIALSMWNHGDGWSVQGDTPPPFISWDMTDNGWMSFAAGHFNEALDPWVAQRGAVDIVGFDACSMASWEVAHTLRGRAEFMVGSETVVGMDGFHYTEIITALQADPDMSTQALADLFAWSAGDYNEEWTFSVTDISQIDTLSGTIDALAESALSDPSLQTALIDARDEARGADSTWQDYYLDLGDFAVELERSGDATLAAHGEAIGGALDAAIPHNYTRAPYAWTQGLTIYADLDWTYLADYVDGSGATWSQETRWDDLLVELAGARPQ